MIRLLIAEDHTLVRRGLEALLAAAPDIEVVAMAADGEQAIALAGRHHPDVVLMDLEMPRVDGIKATEAIASAGNGMHVVVLTSFSDQRRILDALDAGAIGYMLKDAEPDELLRAVRAAADGGSPLDPRAASRMLSARRQARPADDLSDRQRDVLALVAAGKPNKRIAGELGLSEKTVKGHLTAIYQILGVSDRTQAALWAQLHRIG